MSLCGNGLNVNHSGSDIVFTCMYLHTISISPEIMNWFIVRMTPTQISKLCYFVKFVLRPDAYFNNLPTQILCERSLVKHALDGLISLNSLSCD